MPSFATVSLTLSQQWRPHLHTGQSAGKGRPPFGRGRVSDHLRGCGVREDKPENESQPDFPPHSKPSPLKLIPHFSKLSYSMVYFIQILTLLSSEARPACFKMGVLFGKEEVTSLSGTSLGVGMGDLCVGLTGSPL